MKNKKENVNVAKLVFQSTLAFYGAQYLASVLSLVLHKLYTVVGNVLS